MGDEAGPLPILALLWQKWDFRGSPGAECVIHGEPAVMQAGCGYGLAEGSRALARAVSEGSRVKLRIGDLVSGGGSQSLPVMRIDIATELSQPYEEQGPGA